MAARIVIEPVVISGGGARVPLSWTLVDPGRPPTQALDDNGNPISVPKVLVQTSAISSGQAGERNADCLSIVAGVDLSSLVGAAGVTTLFEAGSDRPLADLQNWLTSTPNGLGWNQAKRTRIIDRLRAVGADVTGIAGATPLWHIVNRLGAVWMLGFDVRFVRTMAPGA